MFHLIKTVTVRGDLEINYIQGDYSQVLNDDYKLKYIFRIFTSLLLLLLYKHV